MYVSFLLRSPSTRNWKTQDHGMGDIIISCGYSYPLQPGLNEMRWEASPIIFWLLSSAPLLSDGCKPSQHISDSTFHPPTLLLSLSLPGWQSARLGKETGSRFSGARDCHTHGLGNGSGSDFLFSALMPVSISP